MSDSDKSLSKNENDTISLLSTSLDLYGYHLVLDNQINGHIFPLTTMAYYITKQLYKNRRVDLRSIFYMMSILTMGLNYYFGNNASLLFSIATNFIGHMTFE